MTPALLVIYIYSYLSVDEGLALLNPGVPFVCQESFEIAQTAFRIGRETDVSEGQNADPGFVPSMGWRLSSQEQGGDAGAGMHEPFCEEGIRSQPRLQQLTMTSQ